MCLAYFFGFFGISFLDTEAISESPSTFGLSDLQRHADAARNAEDEKALQKPKKVQKAVTVAAAPKVVSHTPRNDTAICAERAPATIDAACKLSAEQPQVETGDIDEIAFAELNDDEVFEFLINGSLKDYQLEKRLGDYERAVSLRRRLYEHLLDKKLDLIPYAGYDYNKVCMGLGESFKSHQLHCKLDKDLFLILITATIWIRQVFGANCEIVIGYVPIPVGVVGPLTINGEVVNSPSKQRQSHIDIKTYWSDLKCSAWQPLKNYVFVITLTALIPSQI